MLPLLVAAAVACAPFAAVDAHLKSIGENIVIMGKTDEGYLVIYSTPNGESWTIVTVDDKDESEKTCLLSVGRGMRLAAPTGRGA